MERDIDTDTMRRIRAVFLAVSLLMSACLGAGCGTEAPAQETQQEQETRRETEDFLDEAGNPDFVALQEANPEVYAWIRITDTDISFPILQSASDTAYYLNHNLYGEEDDSGCIYTELYNHTDFNDPNTVIYGRNTDEMFGRLHQFADRDFFDAHRQLEIILPDRTLTYEIYAAYTYDDRHLIAIYDFWDEAVFSQYLEDVSAIREMDAFIDDSIQVTAQDKIVTLSTGVTGQSDKRYLVQAVLVS
ncbi:MAG TPA: class B sortase [Candidatus Eisenbergiella stercorigallinarum]|uniref:Class B sortase n=1 Tax=Candidatus Eisenbergiella stercorigallinarum TaxID=2838557 RepID=A0A9D2QZI6_9FIRM|nr:class B sortase [Candidatus Eisenbergiella stercorigallinarum]